MSFLCRILLFLSLCNIMVNVYAVPAYPRKVMYRLADGKNVFITMRGDEHNKWAQTEDGYTILSFKRDWYFAQADSTGSAVRSVYRLCPDKERSVELQNFLKTQPKGILPKQKTYKGIKNKVRIQETSRQKTAVVGERRALIILMSFPDVRFSKEREDFVQLFNQSGYSVDGAQGSVYDYFQEVSYGQLSLYCDVLGPYVASHNMYYYGRNSLNGDDSNPYALFLEAVSYASRNVNLADYDTDGDGFVDNVHIIFAGYGEEAGADSDAIWSHESGFPPVDVNGVKIDRYSCTPELRGNNGDGISRIGPCCHEIGHALGAMDYYDTDYDNGGLFDGTGEWDIMAQGSWNNDGITPAHFNPYVKAYDFGWTGVKRLEKSDDYIIGSSTIRKNEIYRIDTPVSGEYYLLENRLRIGYDYSLPGEGLLIYHVHPDMDLKKNDNLINAASPQLMYPVCASSLWKHPSGNPSSYGEINSAGCSFPGISGNHEFGGHTTPAAFCWDRTPANFGLSDISKTSEGNISFHFINDNDTSFSVESDNLWNEDFEIESDIKEWLVPDQSDYTMEWEQRQEGGVAGDLVSWYYVPEAASGSYYMRFIYKSSFAGVCGGLVSPLTVSNTDGNRVLSFYYQNRCSQDGKAVLDVYCKLEDIGDWLFLDTFTEQSDVWIEHRVQLPVSLQKLQFKFLAKAEGLSGILIDNVSVQECVSEKNDDWAYNHDMFCLNVKKGCLCITLLQPAGFSIFTLDGLMIHSELCGKGEFTYKLPSGFYLVRLNGYCRKIYIP